jgi:sterol desaturase/sphingolipid hydroxylase (fatty acid hydroxylase superfamily)
VRVGKVGASTGTGKPGADRSTWTISVYGTISVAVVVAEYASSSASRLALLVLGYGISLWLAHGYASVVSTERTTWRTALRHSWPVAEASLPALVVVGVAALVGWPNRVAVPLALLACLGNLVAVQVAVLRGGGRRSRQRIAATIALDVVASVLVLAVLTLLR